MKNRKDIEVLLGKILNEIKNNKEVANTIKEKMFNYGVLAGTVRKLMLNTDELHNLSFSILCLLANELYEETVNEEINPSMFGIHKSKIKSMFLNNYKANTQGSYLRVFEKSARTEQLLNKDLCEFTLDEIENVLYELEPLTKSASHVNGRIMTAYIDWSIKNGFTNRENILKDKPMSWFDQFVDTDIQLYFSEKTLRKIEDDCVNAQDAVILRLLFEGVEGKALSEIRNLKSQDVDFFNGELLLTDENGSQRILQLMNDDRALKLIDEAMRQTEYIKKNGHMEENDHMGLTTNLVQNEFVVRSSITKTESYNYAIDKMAIYRRISTIGETLGFPHLSSKNIVRSGMIYMAKQLLEEKGKLDKAEYLQICDRYMVNNWYPVKKFCNESIIKKLYGGE